MIQYCEKCEVLHKSVACPSCTEDVSVILLQEEGIRIIRRAISGLHHSIKALDLFQDSHHLGATRQVLQGERDALLEYLEDIKGRTEDAS